MSDEFGLRDLCFEIWSELGACDFGTLAKEMHLRIKASDRSAALSEALAWCAKDFISHRQVKRGTLRVRLEQRTEQVGDCFVWTGKTGSNGYGCITVMTSGVRKTRAVHRVSYEEFIGPIPDGYQVDHTCHSNDPEACPGRPNCLHIRCWNPAHLRAVTHLENMQGRKSWRGRKAHEGRQRTHCPQGHEFTPENTYSPPSNPYARVCRTCRYLRDQQRYGQQRAA